MTTSESDPLAVVLSNHIWYTTTTKGGKRTHVKCKCTAEMPDSNAHSEHVARIARKFLAAA